MKKLIITLICLPIFLFSWVPPEATLVVNASTTFNLTYQMYGGTNHASNPTSYNDDDADFTLLPASKANLFFQGWYKSEDFTEFDRVDVLPGNHVGVTKLYAKWGIIPYTVDFVTNGGNTIDQARATPKYTTFNSAVNLGNANTLGGYISISRDLNGDGYGDFISFSGSNRHVYMSNGTGGFNYTFVSGNLHGNRAQDNTWFARFIDINDDDLEDLIVVGEANTLTYSLRQPDGSLGTETLFTFNNTGGVNAFAPLSFDMADIDGDGLLDIALAASGRAVYRLNQGSFTFGPAVSVGTYNSYGRAVRMADFNNDGHLDMYASSQGNAFVRFGDGITPFGGTTTSIGHVSHRGFISDVDQDSKIELIGLTVSSSFPSYQGFNDNLTAKSRVIFSQQSFSTSTWYGDEMDINADGFNDLFYVRGSNSGMFISNGDGTYGRANSSAFNLLNASGTIVYDPAYGTFGLMGTSRNSPFTTTYQNALSNQQSVAHLANNTPTRAGYTFAGWYDNAELSGTAFNFSTPVTGNLTLYAKWTLNTFSVDYTLNGGTNSNLNPASVNAESPLITLQDPSKPGSRFLGWYTTSDFSGSTITTIPANSQQTYDLYAKWLDPISVNFVANGGSSVNSITDLPGDPFIAPTAPTRAGYRFDGWFIDNSLNDAYTFNTFPNSNLTLYAKWTALPFNITFETNGGSLMSAIIRTTDQSISLPSNPTRAGYTFAGWFTDSGLTSRFNASVMPPNDVTLYAKWTLNTYSISYNLNGGTNNGANPSSVSIESPSIALATPTKGISRFLGWYTTPDFSGNPINIITTGAQQALTLYAKWLDPITVTYVSNGGTSVTRTIELPGETFVPPANPTRIGYAFVGWYTNSELTNPYTFTVLPDQNLTLYAKWDALSYSITFVTNQGTVINAINLTTDQQIDLPADPTRVGYTFEGWFTNAELTTSFNESTMPPNNVTLYAKWVINSNQLTWSVDGRNESTSVQFDTAIEDLLPTPTKYQHEFLGWAITGTTIIDLSSFTMPDEDIMLTAIFKDNVNPVVFTLTEGDTYNTGVEVIFNEGNATLNGNAFESGQQILLPGNYQLIVTDAAGNRTTVNFTVINSGESMSWILFASVLLGTWAIFAILYFLNRHHVSGNGSGAARVMKTAVVATKPIEKITPSEPIKPVKKTKEKTIKEPSPPPVKKIKVSKPPKVSEVRKIIGKAPPMPEVNSTEIDKQLTETVIFKKPLVIKVDPVESYSPELKQAFEETFVSEKRGVIVPELTYIPQTTNVPFYTNLFRYIHRFAGVLTEGLLTNLTQSVIKLTDDKQAQLNIVEASTRTAEGLKTSQNQDYLLKILRRNVALNRDVLNPRNKYVYSYQRLATLLEDLGIYVEAVIVVREAFERGLIDTPDTTFEKRLSRLENKLIESGGDRQDMLRK